jgi:hypothetical protein
MNLLLSLRLLFVLVAAGLVTPMVLASCVSDLVPSDVALALARLAATPDKPATRAVATFEAALSAPLPFAVGPDATPAPSWTPSPTRAPTPAPTSTPTSTLNRAATEVALQRQINIAVAATLTAQPSATPQATSTPTPASAQLRDALPTPAGMQMLAMIGTVDGGGLVNLRTGSSTDFPVLIGVNSGEQVLILGRNQDASWLQVRTSTGLLGWMSALYVRTGQPPESYPVVNGR